MSEKDEIYKVINNNINEVPEYLITQTNKEELTSNSNNNIYKNMPYIQNYNTNISDQKLVNPKQLDLLPNQNYYNKSSENNVINENFNDKLNSLNYLTFNNPKLPKSFKGNALYFSQDISPIYLSNNQYNSNYKSNMNYNSSQIYNGNTTEEGESNLKYNYIRDSNAYSEKPYQIFSIIDPEDEKGNNNTYDINDEQLIIYPENNGTDKKEKLFDGKEKEGKLVTKDYEIYELNFIEYIPEDKRKYKPVSLGDYILKNQRKMRKTKSCDDLLSNKKKINDYEIKIFTSRKKEDKRKIKNNSYCSESKSNIYNIRTIRKKVYNKKINKKLIKNKNTKKDKKISKVLEHFLGYKKNFFDNNIKVEANKGNNEIIYINKQKNNSRYSSKYRTYHIINKAQYKSKKYPDWKILASACLIQSWWRSLKILYKKYLNKIIIIQKVYKIHYKNKYLLKKKKKYIDSFSYQTDNFDSRKKKSNSKKKNKIKKFK